MKTGKAIQKLSLYHFHSCPYCAITRQAVRGGGLNIELRDTQQVASHRKSLMKHGGKTQVPCLRIDRKDGTSQWLYESAAIIQYIKRYRATQAA
ncbi:MAG: glutaredoxin [Alteromonadaceae bacterium]|nr:MAG: glutaredoxin [Alteromonadaceae bacterium]